MKKEKKNNNYNKSQKKHEKIFFINFFSILHFKFLKLSIFIFIFIFIRVFIRTFKNSLLSFAAIFFLIPAISKNRSNDKG